MTDINLRDDDLKTELWLPDEVASLEERVALLTSGPVCVTHIPTGISAVGEGQGSQVKNRELAIHLLKGLIAREKVRGEDV